MFCYWKTQTSKYGMFKEYSFDQLLHRHKSRMSTMIQEGKVYQETLEAIKRSPTFNPYISGEFGRSGRHGEIKENHENSTKYCKEMRYSDANEMKDEDEHVKNIFEEWRVNFPKEIGVYAQWQNGESKSEMSFSTSKTAVKFQKEKKPYEDHMKRIQNMSRDEAELAMFKGDLFASQKVQQNMLRIFISSSVCDTKSERKIIMEQVYPKLRDICKQNGIDCIIVDLGWGQASASFQEHSFSELCMREMQKCKTQSLDGVPFVLYILTNKYGVPGLPECIDRSEFEYIMTFIKDEDSRNLVNQLYVLDENSVPPFYSLQRNNLMHPLFAAVDKYERRARSESWNSVESRLVQIMHTALDKCYGLRKERMKKWQETPLACQVSFGLEKDFLPEQALCVIREIPQLDPLTLPDIAPHKKIVSQFIDLEKDNFSTDQMLTKKLKNIKSSLKKKFKCKRYMVSWNHFGINDVTHPDYVSHFSSSILKMFTSKIVTALKGARFPDFLALEMASHYRYALEQYKNFFGGDVQVNHLMNYLYSKDCTPHLIHGGVGSGKTYLMSALINQFAEDLSLGKVGVMIVRYCGLMKNQSEKYLLNSICQQIDKFYSQKTGEIFMDSQQDDSETLQSRTIKCFSKATSEKPLFIFIDSVDDLSPTYYCKWMPSQLPAYVKIVVSIQTDRKCKFPSLSQLENDLELKAPTKEESSEIFKYLLTKNKRCLTPKQHDELLKASSPDDSGNPATIYHLYLLFGFFKEVQSQEQVFISKPDTKSLLTLSLQKLENLHGRKLVSHFLCLLLLSQNGLQESHLLDILSTDEECLESILLLNPPPVRRFPYIAFSKLRHDLKDYISEFSMMGDNVLLISDRQMAALVYERYIGDEVHLRQKYYSLIADYYQEVSQDKFTGRCLSPQPLYFKNKVTGKFCFNKSKLMELPQSSALGRNPEVARQLLTNFVFISAKCMAGMLEHLLQDYSVIFTIFPEDESLKAYESFTKAYGHILANDFGAALSHALNEPKKSPVYEHANHILKSSEKEQSFLGIFSPGAKHDSNDVSPIPAI